MSKTPPNTTVIKLTRKQRFVRTAIVSFGFFSGLWVHFGFDPQSWVYGILQTLLVNARPEYSQAITTIFFVAPIISTCVLLLGTYRHAGWLGLLAVALAFYAGVRFDLFGAGFLILALCLGIFAARK